MSLSLVLCAKRRLFRETETPTTTFSLLSLSLSFRSRRKDNEACVCPRRFPRACVQILSTDGKFSPKALRSVSVLYLFRDRKTHEKRRPRVLSLSLDGLATSAYLSRSRIRECKEREKRSKICAEIAFFFPLSFILQLSAHNFHRGLARAKRRRAARSFFSNPTHTGRR